MASWRRPCNFPCCCNFVVPKVSLLVKETRRRKRVREERGRESTTKKKRNKRRNEGGRKREKERGKRGKKEREERHTITTTNVLATNEDIGDCWLACDVLQCLLDITSLSFLLIISVILRHFRYVFVPVYFIWYCYSKYVFVLYEVLCDMKYYIILKECFTYHLCPIQSRKASLPN